MKYKQSKYQEHLAAVQAMRRDVEERLSGIGRYPLIVTDAAGTVPVKRDPDEYVPEDLSPQFAIRVNLSEGTATVENDMTLERQHAILEREGVPHEYTPLNQGADAGLHEREIIRLSIDDAMNHLPATFAKASAEIRGFRFKEQKNIRQR